MKKIYKFIFLFFLVSNFGKSQIGYNFTAVAGAYAANAGASILGANIDEGVSASTAIGFNFSYGCTNYTTFQASSNGVMFLGTAFAGSNLNNNLTSSFDRPAIGPLWDDLKTDPGPGPSSGNVNFKLTGVTPNRILTVEWFNMYWYYFAAGRSVSFQVKLYETSNNIEFVYNLLNAGNITFASASIGIGGLASGDFYSLNGTGPAPTASKLIETTSLATSPATGQVYRFSPILCAGAPAPGTAVASPSLACGTFTSNLSLSGATSACGLTYQWQSGPAVGGPWTNIGGATTSTANVTSIVTTYYRCVLACGASTAASSPAAASITPVGACALCGVIGVALPYSNVGATTCGAGDDVTSVNVTNVCGTSFYYGGEDVVYSFTPATTGQITITYSTSGSSAGIMLYQGCPVSGGTCVSNIQGVSSFSGNQTLCAVVTAGLPYYLVIDSWPFPTCNGYNVSISAPSANATPTCNLTYTAATVAYSFDIFAGTNVGAIGDDAVAAAVSTMPFPFCYDGLSYTQGYISSNGAYIFDAIPCYPNIMTNTYVGPGIATGWSITTPAPSPNSTTPRNAILGPWQDLYPPAGGVIQYTTLGITPNRRFVVSYENVPMYSCSTSSPSIYFSGQIKLFETSNAIEIHVKNKGVCPGWNNGEAILGLHNFNGLIYKPAVNMTIHNALGVIPYNPWNMTNTAYRFTTTCGAGATCLVLPINFKAFYAERIDRINYIYWETGLEENIQSFRVERSTDGFHFDEIAIVKPNNSPSKYTFDDKTSMPGVINYYRITSVEKNNQRTSTFIYPLGANDGEVAVSAIYPNPSGSSFSIGVDSKIITTATFNIMDAFGKVVKSVSQDVRVGVTQVSLYVDDLPAGMYILEVTNSNKEIVSKQKLMKVN